LSIEMPAAVATLAADIGAEAELIARTACVLFAAGAVFLASIVAVLIQLQ